MSSRKDYIRTAEVFKFAFDCASGASEHYAAAAIASLARDMADVYASDSPRFNRERFLRAAGVE